MTPLKVKFHLCCKAKSIQYVEYVVAVVNELMYTDIGYRLGQSNMQKRHMNKGCEIYRGFRI